MPTGTNVIEVRMEVSEYFAGHPLGRTVHQRVLDLLAPFDDVEVRVSARVEPKRIPVSHG